MINIDSMNSKYLSDFKDSGEGNFVTPVIPEKPLILIIEDQLEIAQAITKILRPGYEIQYENSAEKGYEFILSQYCSLILLDVVLPGKTGYWLCEKIKSDTKLRHIPIIFLTGMDDPDDIVNGLNSGADDYLQKPFNRNELLARIQSTLRRNTLNLDANPLTHLPGNGFIQREILRILDTNNNFSLLYIDLNNFKAYNDYYGFIRGDNVIKKTADILINVAKKHECLVCHVGGDDFILMTAEEAEPICENIILEFDSLAPNFYDENERNEKKISVRGRNGVVSEFPLLSISIGVVSRAVRPLKSLGEISAIAAEVKGVAKRQLHSAYFIDRRHDEYPSPQNNTNEKK